LNDDNAHDDDSGDECSDTHRTSFHAGHTHTHIQKRDRGKEDLSLLGCDALSDVKWLLTLQRIILASPSTYCH